MEWPAWYCLAVLLVGVLVMALDIMGPDFAMMAMLITVMLPGKSVITVERALDGFANEGLLTVAVLFVMAAGISETGGLDYAFTQLLGTPETTGAAIVRLVLPVVCISAWLNNTPVVLILIPIVASWARKAGLAPGHLYMPLSFASILGGTTTLIGTSTNLVIAGKQRDSFPDEPPLRLFDLTPYGVPVALAGILYLVLFAPRLLPGKAKTVSPDGDSLEGAFLVGLQVRSTSPAAGHTVAEAGLRGLGGVFLTSVRRRAAITHAVGPDFVVAAGDVLFFAGDVSKVSAVAQRLCLRPVTDAFEEDLPALVGRARRLSHTSKGSAGSDGCSTPRLGDQGHMTEPLLPSPNTSTASPSWRHGEALRRISIAPPTRLMQARVSPDAHDLIDVSVRDANFRAKFHAAIVSIRREGVTLDGKMGDVVLRGGDELLFDCGDDFDAASPIVAANLTKVSAVESAAGQEFMVSFEVLGKGGRKASHGSTQQLSAPRSAGNLLDMKSLVGKTVDAAGLRGLPDAFLVTLERAGTTVHAVKPTQTLQAGDVLWFAAGTEGIISLRKIPGLAEVGDQVEKLGAGVLDRRLVQVVLARTSDLLGRRVRDTAFRSRFDAAIVALHREGARLHQAIGDTVLAAGDVLLLDTGSRFLATYRTDRNFALVAEVSNSQPPRFDRLALALACAGAAIAVYIAGAIRLFTAAAAASAVMLGAGCLSGEAARHSVKWEVIVTIAAAFGLSNALEATGAADLIANSLVAAGHAAGGPIAIQVAVYLATVVLANVVSNNAAAALMYPIAVGVAQSEGLDVARMSYLLMLAASASFAVPFAYQTNLMVYGAGGYTFRDFLRFGGPMQVVLFVASLAVILLHAYLPLITAALAAATLLACTWPAVTAWLRRPQSMQRMDSNASGPSMHTAAQPASDRV
eukprot:jgi/Ulvmu1/10815/UM069_0051.1